MNINILHLFPDLMNLYGDWGNVAMVRRTLEAMGHSVTTVLPNPGEELHVLDADFIYMGAGMESRALHALDALRPYSATLQPLAEEGLPMVFCGTAMDLLGQSLTDEGGTVHTGLGLCTFTAKQGSRRLVGDVMGDCSLTDRPVVGYLNSATTYAGVETPLLTTLALGDKAGCGLLHRNVIGSPLTGPLLVKNPELLRYVITTILTRKGIAFDAVPLAPAALAGHDVTVNALKGRTSGKN